MALQAGQLCFIQNFAVPLELYCNFPRIVFACIAGGHYLFIQDPPEIHVTVNIHRCLVLICRHFFIIITDKAASAPCNFIHTIYSFTGL
ncbi:hypothetical protein D3C73_1338510 [compost metagenome]